MTADLGFAHVYQPAAAPGAPTLLLLHGTGGDEHNLLPLAPLIDPAAGVLSPRGRVLEGRMPRFFRRLAEGVFDLDDLRFRTSELADFVAAAAATYGFDAGKVVAAGFSNGANIAASVLLLRPETLRAAALFSGMLPLEPEAQPDLAGVDVFIGAGRRDPLVPADGVERLSVLLERSGARVVTRWKPGGHELTRDDVVSAAEWYRQLDLAVPRPRYSRESNASRS